MEVVPPVIKKDLPDIWFSYTHFLVLKKRSYMLACYSHESVSFLENYSLGGASSYTEEWMATQGSLCSYNVLLTTVHQQF